MSYPTDLTHVAVYLRKSRADIEAEARGEGETLSKHRRALFELAKKYRYTITDVYEEIVSGERIIDRPEMQRLLHAVQEGRYNAVLCMDIDRLGRGNLVDQGLIQDAFKASRTLIITPRKVYDLQDEMDEEWSEFEAFMARRELKIITRRLQRGRRQSAAEGRSISKKPPYGYLRDENLKLYPDPESAPVVKMIFDMALKGEGRKAIANKLTDLGIPSPAGKSRWDLSTISEILKNPVYLGHIVWGRVSYRKDPSGGGYTRTRVSRDAWIVKEHAHEPLVDEETFQQVRELAKKKQPRVPKEKELSNPLATLVFCSECGHAMRRLPTYNRPYNRLMCGTYGCTTRGARFEIVEERLIQILRDMLSGFQADEQMNVAKPRKRYALLELTERKIEGLLGSIEELQKQRNNLHDLLERGIYDVDTFLERNRIVSDRLEQAQDELEKANEELAYLREQEQRQEQIVPKMTRVLEAYEKAETAKEKNDLLKEIVEKVIYVRPQEWKDVDRFDLEVYLRF
ncbi:recombinase family protein [Effusibacillus pohliae]|uniref:recombinase family protein n=1 Tax=Effusibacillus pohliae TaxID=232270 RepID=UPI000367C3F5|nr:recombinase family protein [Effusibacillus pohliae]